MLVNKRKAIKTSYVISIFIAFFLFGSQELVANTESPTVYFINLQNDDKTPTTFVVQFGLKGLGIAPAGIQIPSTGHHHLLIDYPTLPNLKNPLGANDNIKHYGKGQTEAVLTLSPGKHTLQLVLGDHEHVPLSPPVLSEKITIEVSQQTK
ncbi:MAG: DUF4399 domain-containing protein [Gammaproteobacteria bacterium]|jgi:hypothetical protein|tara:strand:- start:999 stop:1451 length:453 start_codon:yes stop_codon:yes gene_type:complete